MSLQNILAKTEEYLSIPSVIRYEQPFISRLADDFNLPGYEVERKDRVLTVRKRGPSSSRIIFAHIDRHGIVIDKEGRPEFAALNAKRYYGLELRNSEEFRRRLAARFVGEDVYAYDKSGNEIASGQVQAFSIEDSSLFFEIKGMPILPSDTPIAYKSSLMKKDGKVSSQIDNAISMAVIYQLVREGFDGSVIFSTEEEIGRSWMYVRDYLVALDIDTQELINLDTTPYDDERAIMNGLIVLRNKDNNADFNEGLVYSLKESCKRAGIRFEMKDEVIEAENAQLPESKKPKKLGNTELGRIVQHTNGKLNGATIQLPTTNYHTNYETTSELALGNYYKVLKLVL